MTERKRLHKIDPLAPAPTAVEQAVSHAAAPFRTAVPAARGPQDLVEVGPGLKPVDQLRRHYIRRDATGVAVKPAKPAHLSSEQKLTNYFDVAGEDFRQRNADKLSDEIVKGSGEKARTPTPESRELAAQLFAAAKASLQGITEHVEAAMNLGKGRRKGAEFVLKNEDGLAGKIAEELAKKKTDSQTPEQAMKEIDVSALVGDALRFTIVYDFDGFTDKVLEALSFLEKQGYTAEKVGNTFKNPNAMYRGINTNWRAGKGIKWELQFHTDDSYDVKTHKNHKPYEGARNLKDGDSRKTILEKQMGKVSAGIATPSDLGRVKKDQWDVETRPRSSKLDDGPPVPEGLERIKEK